jgi:pyruvate/2-oxoglutarate dehydrogenase complex dihydrolipoamide dehydrogenase (E3) component
MVGIETAEFLCEKGHKVTVVTSRSGMESLATDMEGTTRTLLLKRLPTMDIRFIFSAKVLEICGNQVHLTQDGQEQRLCRHPISLTSSSSELFSLKEGA